MWLYLFSSNARKRYFSDVIESLGLPRGWVQHYRYQLRYVDAELRGLLPLGDGESPPELRRAPVVIIYLYQIRDSERRWDWRALYPARFAELVRASKTGDRDSDIAHFYFRLGDHWLQQAEPPARSWDPWIRETLGQKLDKDRAWLAITGAAPSGLAQREISDESAFRLFIEDLAREHLRGGTTDIAEEQARGELDQDATRGRARPGTSSPAELDAVAMQQERTFYPLFSLLRGIKRRKGRVGRSRAARAAGGEWLQPVFDDFARHSYYELAEGTDYVLELSYHLREDGLPGPGSALTQECDKNAFSTPERREVPVGSRYDEVSWLLTTAAADTERWTGINLRSKLSPPPRLEAVDLELAIPVHIRPKRLGRVSKEALTVLGDVGLAGGTVAVTLSRTSPPGIDASQWLRYAALGYLIWLVARVARMVWR